MPDSQKINTWILDWFEENSIASRDVVSKNLNQNYFEKNWIDSLIFVSFIMDVEQEFDIGFSNDEFQNRDFSTINGLIKIISKHVDNKNE